MMSDFENSRCDDTAVKMMSAVLEESCPMTDKECRVVTMSKWSKQEKGSEQGDQEEDKTCEQGDQDDNKTSDADHYKEKGSMDQLETEKEGCHSDFFTSYEPQISEILQQHRNVPSAPLSTDEMVGDCEISPWILQSMDQPPKEEKQPIGSSDGASSTSQPGYQGNEAGLGSAGWGAADDGDDGEPPNRSRQSHILSQCEASTSFQVKKKQPGNKAKMLEERHFDAYINSCEEPMTDLQLVPDESDKPRSLDPGQPVGNLSMDRHFPSPTEGGFEPLALDVDGVHQTPNEPLGSCFGAYSNEAGPLTFPRNPPSSYDKNHQQAVAVNDALMEDIGLLDPSEPPGNMLVDSHFPTPAEGGYRSLDPAGNVLVDNHFPPPAEGRYGSLEPADDGTGLTGSETTVHPQQETLGAASAQPPVLTLPSMAGQERWLGVEDDDTGLTGSETTVDPQQEALGAASAQPLVSTLPSMAGQERWLGGEGAYSNEAGPLASLNTPRNPPSSSDKNHQQAVAVNDKLMTGVWLN